MLRGIIESLGSKSLAAAIGYCLSILGIVIGKIVGQKYGVEIADALIADYALKAGGIVAVFIFAKWHLDVKTGGQTSTAALLLGNQAIEAKKVELAALTAAGALKEPNAAALASLVPQIVDGITQAFGPSRAAAADMAKSTSTTEAAASVLAAP